MANENARHEAKSNRNRGSTNNAKRLEKFRKSADGKRDLADWGNVEAALVRGIIVGATYAGAAVTFGLSRDGGAYMLTLLLEGDRETLWFNADADLEYELKSIAVMLEDMRL